MQIDSGLTVQQKVNNIMAELTAQKICLEEAETRRYFIANVQGSTYAVPVHNTLIAIIGTKRKQLGL